MPKPKKPSAERDLLIQIEFYSEINPRKPRTFKRFQKRMNVFAQEYEQWASAMMDSSTFAELACRKMHQYSLNPDAKDPRQWYGGSTEGLEEMLMMRFASLPMNVGVACHVDEQKDEVHGMMRFNPAAPGRLSKRLAAAFGEFYHLNVIKDDDGADVHQLQTHRSNLYNAATQIGAPNHCFPSYKLLWENWPKGLKKPPIHTLVYSDSGGGKSTFLATYPKPMVVFFWDPPGKDIPYIKKGNEIEELEDEFGTRVLQVFKGGKG